MDIEVGKSYNKHKLKVYAYIKAKRLIRKQNKTFSNKEAGAAMAMSMAKGGGEDDEDEMERIMEERNERIEKNRAWRERKEREKRRLRGEVSEDEESCEAGSTSTLAATAPYMSELRSQFSCTACKQSLTGRVWQCQVGHPVCRNCVDKSWLQEDDISSSMSSLMSNSRKSSKSSVSSISSLDRFSNISDNSVKEMIEHMTEQELMDLMEVSSTTSSNVTFSGPSLAERNIREINWFKNTLNNRKEAITAYKDYHEESLGDGVFRVYDEDEDDGEEPDLSNWDVIPKDEIELKNEKVAELSLQSSTETDHDSGNETQSDSSRVTFSGGKPKVVNPIDWFKGTITVKKDVIQPYYDYHEEEEEDGGKGVTFKDDVEYIENEVRYNDDDDDSLESASVLERRIRHNRSKTCQDCDAPIIGRNMYLENLAKTVFK